MTHCIAGRPGYPLEFVYIWNKNNGQRISTYVIYGKPGSACCILNGSAARTCQVGDEVIISAVEYVQRPKDLCEIRPQALTFNADDSVREHLEYDVSIMETATSTSTPTAFPAIRRNLDSGCFCRQARAASFRQQTIHQHC